MMQNNASSHAGVQSLLPWWLNNTLPATDRAAVDAHLRDCGECLDALAELQALDAHLMAAPRPVPHPGAALQALLARIDAEAAGTARPRAAPRAASALERLRASLKPWFPVLMPGLVAACAVAVALVGVPRAAVVPDVDAAAPNFHTLSSQAGTLAGSASSVTLRVVFASTITEMGARTIIEALGGRIVAARADSPAVIARWQDAAARDLALRHLRSRADVRFAEPGALSQAAP